MKKKSSVAMKQRDRAIDLGGVLNSVIAQTNQNRDKEEEEE